MSKRVEMIFGERRNFRSGKAESWAAIDDWLGFELPMDYREFVDGYGYPVVAGHLYIPHPDGTDPLLDFIREERLILHEVHDGNEGSPSEYCASGTILCVGDTMTGMAIHVSFCRRSGTADGVWRSSFGNVPKCSFSIAEWLTSLN
ncbi:hypothetical protein [Streptomyces sp. H39-S7]|uniref:hypothetical protein n=1 Tax=Streptomyces sp. H39-S7 TaxID=3004357 RepID=UPI0022B02313|nr:hypothetical protein [Streptomyces sp. H39-S7]MCZ4121672.1 hypothetical protein [Streptomyces sp. H39-S7]